MSAGKKKDVLKNRGRNRAVRPKSFKTEENAKKYGTESGREFVIEKIGKDSRPKYRVRLQ